VGLDPAAPAEVAHHQDGPGAEEEQPEGDQSLAAAEPDEQALEQHVGAVADAEDGVVGQGEREELVQREQRKREEQAVARRPGIAPVGGHEKRGRRWRPPQVKCRLVVVTQRLTAAGDP